MAIVLDSEKFSDLFSSMEKQMMVQSSLLRSMHNLQSQRFAFEKDQAKDEARRREREKLEDYKPDGVTEKGDGNGAIVPSVTDKDKNAFFSALWPGIGTFFGEIFSSSNILKAGIGGIIALGIGPILGEFITGFASSALEDVDLSSIGLDDKSKAKIASSIGKAVKYGFFASAFGKKYAFAAMGASLINDTIIAAIWGDDQNLFDDPVNRGILDVASTMALAFAPSVIKNMILKQYQEGGVDPVLDANGKASKAFKSRFKSFFKRGFIGLGIAGLGQVLGAAVEEATGNEELGDAIKLASNLAGIGSLFGPQGAFVGAIVGLAASGVISMMNWLRNRQKGVREKAYAEADEVLSRAGNDLSSLSEEDIDKLYTAKSEAARVAQLNLEADEKKRAKEHVNNISEVLMNVQKIKTGSYNPDHLRDYFKQTVDNESLEPEVKKQRLEETAHNYSELMNSRGENISQDEAFKDLAAYSGQWSFQKIEQLYKESPKIRDRDGHGSDKYDPITTPKPIYDFRTQDIKPSLMLPQDHDQRKRIEELQKYLNDGGGGGGGGGNALIAAASLLQQAAVEAAKVQIDAAGYTAKAVAAALSAKNDGGSIVIQGSGSNAGVTLGGGHQ